MADQALTRLMRKARTGHAGRSEAYGWLRARFEPFYPALERRNLSFREIAEELAIDGIPGGRGRPMTAHAARRTWGRVVHDITVEEPWRVDAARAAMQEGWPAQKPRRREPERGKDADRPPPVVVTTPAPMSPVPYYPPPVLPPPKPLLKPELASRPHEELSEEEREAYAEAQILRLRRKVAEMSGHDPDEVR